MKDICLGRALAVFVLLSLASGCSQNSGSPAATGGNVGHGAITAEIQGQPEHAHDGWWCNEHGVPEEVCGRCNAKLAAEFQKKGDWCQNHDCPDSQCFACHPELEAKFAAQYEAKLGKQPPKPEG